MLHSITVRSIQNLKNSQEIVVYKIVRFFGLNLSLGYGLQLNSNVQPWLLTDGQTDVVLNFLEHYFIITPLVFDKRRSCCRFAAHSEPTGNKLVIIKYIKFINFVKYIIVI